MDMAEVVVVDGKEVQADFEAMLTFWNTKYSLSL